MKTEMRDCKNCRPKIDQPTEHVLIGFVPQAMFEDTSSELWLKATVCSRCGSLHAQDVSDREMDWAERRFLRVLVDTGNMSAQDAKEILGMV